ncbi:S8 family serine peptidase [Imperialibacter roseus]|uniref:S8 family serine peptidase n=1 Tax=Imperialibacter roseus TaxID=1324217 RepID=A0ABZ0IKR5_9BACT|nr:S8 family serine peptidase [Imperialibacter roseus]WOK05612.1 S8 family serine peptidase [Imperialibacter roseus]
MSDSKIAHRKHFRSRYGLLKVSFICLLSLQFLSARAQDKYWYFISEGISKTESQKILESLQLEPVTWSKWFHAWSAHGSLDNEIDGVDSCRKVTPLKLQRTLFEEPTLGFALEQMDAKILTNEGLTGKGVKIGIIDGGFLGAEQTASLAPIIADGRLVAFRNFLQPSDTDPFGGFRSLDDQHGTEVWELTGGYNAQKRIQFGLATGADYYLARTDHGAREQRQEEDFLIAALEWMDSLEVKLVNISLGYNTDYDNPAENYTPAMMDGKTALASLACQRATEEKGMLIVVAAGNDGDNSWKVIDVPADAPGVLTVGSTDLKFWRKMPFSSTGTDFTPFLKPEISCFASSGTSFSAPVITGLAACLWEKSPALSNTDLKALILQSGHLAGAPNNYMGHGVPSAKWLLFRITQDLVEIPEPAAIAPQSANKKKSITLEGEGKKNVVLFHKKDRFSVIKQEFFSTETNSLQVKQLENAKFTTVIVDHELVMEVEWE